MGIARRLHWLRKVWPKTLSSRDAVAALMVLAAAAIASLAPNSAYAQPTPSIALPTIHVEAPSQTQPPQTCVDVEVNGERQPAFDCLNDQLKAAAGSTKPADPKAPLKAVIGNGEPNEVGTFSYTGTAEQYGNTFGKSAFPQRPNPPVYSNALTAGVK